MKTQEEINRARSLLCQRLINPRLTELQRSTLQGMLLALVWTANGEQANTFDRLMAGDPITEFEVAE